MKFKEWMQEVDKHLLDITGKVSGQLWIPIETWNDVYSEGIRPASAAKNAVRLIFSVGVPGPASETEH